MFSRWCYTPTMKTMWSIVASCNVFENMILRNLFSDPVARLCNRLQSFFYNFARGSPNNKSHAVLFNWDKLFRRIRFSYIIQCKIMIHRAGLMLTQEHNLNNNGRGPLDDVIYKIWNILALWIQWSYKHINVWLVEQDNENQNGINTRRFITTVKLCIWQILIKH